MLIKISVIMKTQRFLVFSLVFLALGGIFTSGSTLPRSSVVKITIQERAKLAKGTMTWDRWVNPDSTIYQKIYVFNTANPDDVIKGAKPVLEEFGPYVYEEKRVKVDIELHEENDTVSYRQPIQYFFRPDLSNGTEGDTVTVLNMPLALLALKGAKEGFLAQMVFSSIISEHEEEQLFSVTTVGELLYKGRYVPMMKSLEDSTGYAPLRNYTFGVFFPKNGSDEGRLEVKTGVEDGTQFGRVVSWKGESKLNFWDGDTCNMINGTDGSLFPPFVQRDRTVYLFSTDLCRSLYLTYDKDVEVKGIAGYHFAVPREALEGAAENENNACFCKDAASDYSNCLGTGAIQLSACRRGAPIVMSTPHFFDGDEKYIQQSIGLKPDKEKHQTFVELEPNTGLLLRAHKRLQINVELTSNDLSSEYENVPTMIYPILWYDQIEEISEDRIAEINKLGFQNIIKAVEPDENNSPTLEKSGEEEIQGLETGDTLVAMKAAIALFKQESARHSEALTAAVDKIRREISLALLESKRTVNVCMDAQPSVDD